MKQATYLMPNNYYKTLPLESLYELLTDSIKNMLIAFESEDDYRIAFKPLKKQIEILIAEIEEKKKERTG
jgi:hypothetical protein